MIYQCCDEKRKAAVIGNPTLNGIDYLEVLGFDAEPLGLQPQTILMVRCLKAAPTGLTPDNIIIAGGESITNIRATFVTPADTPPASMTAAQQNYFTSLPGAANILLIGVSVPGDFSPYTLWLVNSATQAQEDPFEVTEVLAGFDPQLAEVEFSFKVECPPRLDADWGTSPAFLLGIELFDHLDVVAVVEAIVREYPPRHLEQRFTFVRAQRLQSCGPFGAKADDRHTRGNRRSAGNHQRALVQKLPSLDLHVAPH